MIDFFQNQPATIQALLAGLWTWILTALGASLVFFRREVHRRFMVTTLGFAGGVMLAASFWSLLVPAIEMARSQGVVPWVPALVGFLAGGIFLAGLDKILPHLHTGRSVGEAEGMESTWRRSILLVSAIALHNIPEGLAVGVAFGGAAVGAEGSTFGGALALAIGIGFQNFPEGLAVAMPLRGEGVGRLRSFWYGQLSAIVEPIAAVAGAAFVMVARPILPYALAFAAGAMIFVVVEEVVPASQGDDSTDLATASLLVGFSVMMVLDVALG